MGIKNIALLIENAKQVAKQKKIDEQARQNLAANEAKWLKKFDDESK